MGEEGVLQGILHEYRSSLADLRVNSKPLIDMLTIVAEEHKQYAQHIALVIEERLYEVNGKGKLLIFYLIDSIVKNVGKEYKSMFIERLDHNFRHAFDFADEEVRKSLYKLRTTWNDQFSHKKLLALDAAVHKIDGNWPIKNLAMQMEEHTSKIKKQIHINPKFFAKKTAANNNKEVLSQQSSSKLGRNFESSGDDQKNEKAELEKKIEELQAQLAQKEAEIELKSNRRADLPPQQPLTNQKPLTNAALNKRPVPSSKMMKNDFARTSTNSKTPSQATAASQKPAEPRSFIKKSNKKSPKNTGTVPNKESYKKIIHNKDPRLANRGNGRSAVNNVAKRVQNDTITTPVDNNNAAFSSDSSSDAGTGSDVARFSPEPDAPTNSAKPPPSKKPRPDITVEAFLSQCEPITRLTRGDAIKKADKLLRSRTLSSAQHKEIVKRLDKVFEDKPVVPGIKKKGVKARSQQHQALHQQQQAKTKTAKSGHHQQLLHMGGGPPLNYPIPRQPRLPNNNNGGGKKDTKSVAAPTKNNNRNNQTGKTALSGKSASTPVTKKRKAEVKVSPPPPSSKKRLAPDYNEEEEEEPQRFEEPEDYIIANLDKEQKKLSEAAHNKQREQDASSSAAEEQEKAYQDHKKKLRTAQANTAPQQKTKVETATGNAKAQLDKAVEEPVAVKTPPLPPKKRYLYEDEYKSVTSDFIDAAASPTVVVNQTNDDKDDKSNQQSSSSVVGNDKIIELDQPLTANNDDEEESEDSPFVKSNTTATKAAEAEADQKSGKRKTNHHHNKHHHHNDKPSRKHEEADSYSSSVYVIDEDDEEDDKSMMRNGRNRPRDINQYGRRHNKDQPRDPTNDYLESGMDPQDQYENDIRKNRRHNNNNQSSGRSKNQRNQHSPGRDPEIRGSIARGRIDERRGRNHLHPDRRFFAKGKNQRFRGGSGFVGGYEHEMDHDKQHGGRPSPPVEYDPSSRYPIDRRLAPNMPPPGSLPPPPGPLRPGDPMLGPPHMPPPGGPDGPPPMGVNNDHMYRPFPDDGGRLPHPADMRDRGLPPPPRHQDMPPHPHMDLPPPPPHSHLHDARDYPPPPHLHRPDIRPPMPMRGGDPGGVEGVHGDPTMQRDVMYHPDHPPPPRHHLAHFDRMRRGDMHQLPPPPPRGDIPPRFLAPPPSKEAEMQHHHHQRHPHPRFIPDGGNLPPHIQQQPPRRDFPLDVQAGGRMADGVAHKPPASVAPPLQQPAAVVVPPPTVDVSKLLSDLLSRGVIKPESKATESTAAAKDEASNVKAGSSTDVSKESDNKSDEKTASDPQKARDDGGKLDSAVQEELDKLEVDLDATVPEITFKSDLKMRHELLIERLHTGKQCSACGYRFTTKQTELYAKHLDWHFRLNRKGKDGTVSHRELYPSADEWINWEIEEDPNKPAEGEGDQEDAQVVISTVTLTGRLGEDTCLVCKEPFNTFYNEEEDEWQFANCVSHNNNNFHPSCYEDYKQTAGDSPPPMTPIKEPVSNLFSDATNTRDSLDDSVFEASVSDQLSSSAPPSQNSEQPICEEDVSSQQDHVKLSDEKPVKTEEQLEENSPPDATDASKEQKGDSVETEVPSPVCQKLSEEKPIKVEKNEVTTVKAEPKSP